MCWKMSSHFFDAFLGDSGDLSHPHVVTQRTPRLPIVVLAIGTTSSVPEIAIRRSKGIWEISQAADPSK